MKIVSCKNCRTCYCGKYCPHCGQAASVGRLNWKTLRDNMVYSVIHADRGFLPTVKALFTRPGYMMRDYLGGKRVGLFRPFSMLIILSGAYVLLSTYVFPGTNVPDEHPEYRTETVAESAPSTIEKEEVIDPGTSEIEKKENDRSFDDTLDEIGGLFNHDLLKKVKENPVSFSILFIFSIAWVAPWIFRRNGGRKYNYVEYLFIGAYMSSQRFLYDIAILPYLYFTASYDWFIDKGFLIVVGYVGLTAWNHKQLFGMRWVSAVLKTIGLMIAALFVAILLIALIMALIVIITTVVALVLR